MVSRLWARIMQSEEIKKNLAVLEGGEHSSAVGEWQTDRGERWVITKQGLNERMRFLKYGSGQFFRRKSY